MRELFIAECLRLRKLVGVYALLHLFFLLMMGRMVDLLQQETFDYALIAFVHVLAALAFGAWQIRSYRRPSAWLYLLHRPLAPARIGAAVLGAGTLGAAIAVAMPILVGIAAQASFTVRVVDTRHLGLALAGALLAAAGQLAGALLVIAPLRHLFAIIALLAWPAAANAMGVGALLVQLIVVVWLAALALLAFRPDPHAVPRRFVPSALLALPVAAGLALVLHGGGSLAIQFAWIAEGSHPLNSKPPVGGWVEATRAESRELLGVGDGPEPLQILRVLPYLPHRHALTNLTPLEIQDKRRGTLWVFSHDEMRFIGMDLARVERRGVLDVPGGFTTPPVPAFGVVLDATRAYVLDEETGVLERIASVPDGEVLAATPERHGRVWAVLSNRALRLNDANDTSVVVAELPLPTPIGDLDRIDLVEDGAGHRVSLVTASRHRLYRLEGGQVRLLSERPLAPDFPWFLSDLELVVSPALLRLRDEALALFAPDDPLAVHSLPVPARLSWIVALVLSLAAAGFVAHRGRSLRLPRRHLFVWSLAALALGVPMALAFRLMERR